MEAPQKRAQPIPGQPTTYRGLHDMAGWWQWSKQAERPLIETYRPFIKPWDLCFDIGANRGRKTWIMRQLGARVVAVEPLLAFGDEFVPEFWWMHREDKYVKPVARAVARNGSVRLQINKFMPYVSSMDRAWMTESKHGTEQGQPYYQPNSLIERKVQAITLDGLIGIYGIPRFMKVDVEGAENEVFSTLSIPIPAFNMEFHEDWLPIEAMQHMDSLGRYEWTYALGEYPQFKMGWATSEGLVRVLRHRLTKSGRGSWGDIYGRLVD